MLVDFASIADSILKLEIRAFDLYTQMYCSLTFTLMYPIINHFTFNLLLVGISFITAKPNAHTLSGLESCCHLPATIVFCTVYFSSQLSYWAGFDFILLDMTGRETPNKNGAFSLYFQRCLSSEYAYAHWT